MKKLLLTGLLLSAFISSNAQCADLFISEYVEGAIDDKALELYNPTPNPITVNGNYRLVRYANGTDQPTSESNPAACLVLGINDPGNTGTNVTPEPFTIPPYGTWVIVLALTDPNGVGNQQPVSQPLQALADTFMCPNYNTNKVMYFNGDDAMGLQKWNGSAWVFVDIFGEIGVDPSGSSIDSGDRNGWTDCPPFFVYSAADCNWKHVMTADRTLIRNHAVTGGVTVNPDPFVALDQWDTLTTPNPAAAGTSNPNNTRNITMKVFNGTDTITVASTMNQLRSHTCDCNAVGIKDVKAASSHQVVLFPNPAANGALVSFVSADKRIASIVITNALGQIVKEIALTSPALQTSQELNLAKGLYFTVINFADRTATNERLIIE
jgi:hypothetical protein